MSPETIIEEVLVDRGHEADVSEEVVHEKSAHEVRLEGKDTGVAHPFTPPTTIASPSSPSPLKKHLRF